MLFRDVVIQDFRVSSAARRMRAMSVFPRFRRAFMFRPMIVHMRVCMRMTMDQVAMAVLVIVGVGMGMLMLCHLEPRPTDGASID